MNQDNAFEPQLQNPTPKDDSEQKYVRSFNEFYDRISQNQKRKDLLDQVEEDKKIYDNRRLLLPQKTKMPLLGVSDYDLIIRKVRAALRDIPKITAQKKGESPIVLSAIESAVETALDQSDFESVWDDCLTAIAYESQIVIEKGISDDQKHQFSHVNLAEMFFETDGIKIQHGGSPLSGKNIRIAIREVSMTYGEFLQRFPTMKNKVAAGHPSNQNFDESRNLRSNQEENAENELEKEKISVRYAYSVVDPKNPVMVVYAGAQNTICEDKNGEPMLAEGKDYPFWQGKNPVLPFYTFSVFDRRSVIGIIKDIAEASKKTINAGLKTIPDQANYFLMLLGGDEDLAEKIRFSREQQAIGRNPIIQSQQNVDIKTITPDLKIWEGIEIFMRIAASFIRKRTGINIDEPEQNKIKATLFVGQQAEESKATSEIRKENRITFQHLANSIVCDIYKMGLDYSLGENPLSSKVDSQMQVSVSLSKEEIFEFLKNWDGKMVAEMDFKTTFSIPEKRQLFQDIDQALYQFTQFVLSLPPTARAAAEMAGESLFARICLAKMESTYPKEKIAQIIDQSLPIQPQPLQPLVQNSQAPEPFVGEKKVDSEFAEVEKELAPTPQNALQNAFN